MRGRYHIPSDVTGNFSVNTARLLKKCYARILMQRIPVSDLTVLFK
jgi:hypothetical protein